MFLCLIHVWSDRLQGEVRMDPKPACCFWAKPSMRVACACQLCARYVNVCRIHHVRGTQTQVWPAWNILYEEHNTPLLLSAWPTPMSTHQACFVCMFMHIIIHNMMCVYIYIYLWSTNVVNVFVGLHVCVRTQTNEKKHTHTQKMRGRYGTRQQNLQKCRPAGKLAQSAAMRQCGPEPTCKFGVGIGENHWKPFYPTLERCCPATATRCHDADARKDRRSGIMLRLF